MSRAALELSITQPSLTKRLQNLEDRHGITLFERRPRGMELTRAGQKFLHHAKRIEQEYLQAQEALTLLKAARLDELRIGAGPLFHIRYMADAVHRLRAAYPDLNIHLEAGVNPTLLPKLRNGEIDMVFGSSEALDEDDPLAFTALTKVNVGVVIDADNPLVRGHAADLALEASDLSRMEWVIYSENPYFQELVSNFFERSGLVAPDFVLRTTSFLAGLQYVQRGNAVMTIPMQLEQALPLANLKVVATRPLISENVAGVFVRKSSQEVAEICALRDIIYEMTAGDRP